MATSTQTLTGISVIVGGANWVPNPPTVANLNANDANYDAITGSTKNTAIGELDCNTFGFDSTLPDNIVIVTVDLNIRWKVSTTASVANLGIAPKVSTSTGSKTQVTSEPTVDTLSTVAAVARPGGGNWVRADLLNAVYSVRLYADQGNSATSVTYSFGFITTVVTYSINGPEWAGAPFGLSGARQMQQLLAQ